MSSPKGTSKFPQSAMYKDGKCKVVEQSEVEALMADGWCDNPAEIAAETVEADAPADEPTPEAETSEEGSESKSILGSLKDKIIGGDDDEKPAVDEGSADKSED